MELFGNFSFFIQSTCLYYHFCKWRCPLLQIHICFVSSCDEHNNNCESDRRNPLKCCLENNGEGKPIESNLFASNYMWKTNTGNVGKTFLLCKLTIWFAVWWNCTKFDWRLWSTRIFQRRSVQLYGWFGTASIQVVSYWSSSIRCIMACWSSFDECMEYLD